MIDCGTRFVYHLENASRQKTHKYGFSPESVAGDGSGESFCGTIMLGYYGTARKLMFTYDAAGGVSDDRCV